MSTSGNNAESPDQNDLGDASPMATLPTRLAQVLSYAGVSQREMAIRVDHSPGFLSDLMRGVKRPGAEILLALHKHFGVSIDWLLSGQGTMTGSTGIRPDLFRAVRMQIALARAAVVGGRRTAIEILQTIRNGDLAAVSERPLFADFLAHLVLEEQDVDLAVQLYNSTQWASDPISQKRNLLEGAIAHFEARKPIDILSAITGKSRD